MEGEMIPERLKKLFDVVQTNISMYANWEGAAADNKNFKTSAPLFLVVDGNFYINRCLKLTERKKCPSR